MWTYCFDFSRARTEFYTALPAPHGEYHYFGTMDDYTLLQVFVQWCSNYLLPEAHDEKVRVRVIFDQYTTAHRRKTIQAVLSAYFRWIEEKHFYENPYTVEYDEDE